MRMLVVVTGQPFEAKTTEYVTGALCHAFRESGHEIEYFNLPFSSDYETMVEEMLALRLLDFRGIADRLIAIGTASHVVKHDYKIVWLMGDQGVDVLSAAGRHSPGDRETFVRHCEPLLSANIRGLRESAAVFATSDWCVQRLAEHGIESRVLRPPSEAGSADHPRDGVSEAEPRNGWTTVVERLLFENHRSQ
jgi:hypothetical protein